MNIFVLTLESVVALLGIGLLGFWIIQKRMVPENIFSFLSPLVLDIALPCLVFTSIFSNFSPSEIPDWWQLPLWWILFTLVLFVLVIAAMFVSQKSTRGEFAIGLFFQNGLFFPLFIISAVFGKESPYLTYLFLFLIFHPPLVFGTYYLPSVIFYN